MVPLTEMDLAVLKFGICRCLPNQFGFVFFWLQMDKHWRSPSHYVLCEDGFLVRDYTSCVMLIDYSGGGKLSDGVRLRRE